MEVDSPKGRIMISYGLLTKEIAEDESVVRALQRCALCGICEKDCPSMVRIVDIIKAARNDLKTLLPEHEKLINEIKNMEFSIPSAKKIFFIPPEGKLMEKEIKKIATMLDATPLYANCGDAIERIGKENDVAERLIEQMKNAGVEEIIFYNHDCMKYFNSSFNVKSIFDILDEFSFDGDGKEYIIHRPAGISDEEYEKIKSFLSPLKIVEPEKDKCCGCREEFRKAFPQEAEKMAYDVINEANSKNMVVLTLSPSCYSHLSKYGNVVDIVQLINGK